jgi:polygalacturonase
MPATGAAIFPAGPDPFAPMGGQRFYLPQPNVTTSLPALVPDGTQLFYSSAAAQTTVAQDLGGVLAVNSISGNPAQYPFKLLLEWGAANQEVVVALSRATGSPYAYNVLRGQDGTAQVTHAAGAQVNHGVSAQDFFQIMPVFNVCAYGADPTGASDSYPAIQAALTTARLAGGGIVYQPPGVYTVSNILQIASNTWLQGAGIGTTTIRMMGYSWVNAQQVSPNILGVSALQAYNPNIASLSQSTTQTINPFNTGTVNNVRITGITFDGNQQGITAFPAWADAPSCSPLGMDSVNNLVIDSCQIINAIGYTLYLFACTNFTVSNNRVLAGQVSSPLPWGTPTNQDGIHVSSSQYGLVASNIIDTGVMVAVGDDAIALQAWSSTIGCQNITVTGNICRSANSGIDLAVSGGAINNVAITGNVFWMSQADGINIRPYAAGSTIVSNVSITGNLFSSVGMDGFSNGVNIAEYGTEGYTAAPGWADIVISDNSFNNFNAPGQFGIYAVGGTGLQIKNNNFDNWNAYAGIQIGDVSGALSYQVSNYQVSGNTINMASDTNGSNVFGVFISDSYNGTVSANVISGPGSAVTNSWGVLVLGSNNAPYGNVIQGNRITGWLNPCGEANGGVAPNNNNFSDNLAYGCGNPAPITGPNTVVGGQMLVQTTTATAGATGTASQSITGLLASLNVGSYYVEITIPWKPSGTVGAFSTWGFLAGSGLVLSAISMASLIMPGSTTAEAGTTALVISTTLSDAMWAGPTQAGTAGYGLTRLWGTMTVSTAGTLQVVFADNTSGDEITVAAGATIIARPLI